MDTSETPQTKIPQENRPKRPDSLPSRNPETGVLFDLKISPDDNSKLILEPIDPLSEKGIMITKLRLGQDPYTEHGKHTHGDGQHPNDTE